MKNKQNQKDKQSIILLKKVQKCFLALELIKNILIFMEFKLMNKQACIDSNLPAISRFIFGLDNKITQNLQSSMGSSSSIKVASLNFSGINTNPFQFNDGSDFFKTLNTNYELIKNAEFPDMRKWSGVSIDKHFKNNRFSILCGDHFIPQLTEKLFTKQTFEKKWMEAYQSQKPQILKKLAKSPTSTQEMNLLQMDYSFYRAVTMTVYNFKSLEEFDEKSPQADVSTLRNFLTEFKNRPPFKLDVKQQLTEKFYQSVDVMFLQEAGTVEWPEVQGYTAVKNHDSVIIYKTEVFGKVNWELTEKWRKPLDVNDDTAIAFTENNYLLISSHFTSKNPGFLEDQAMLFKGIQQVYDSFEDNKKPILITGMDANHFITRPEMKGNINIAPEDKKRTTTKKRRTYIQAQLNKADVTVNEVKDHILSTLPINDFTRVLVSNKEASDQLLPNNEHPYDHFIIMASLEVK